MSLVRDFETKKGGGVGPDESQYHCLLMTAAQGHHCCFLRLGRVNTFRPLTTTDGEDALTQKVGKPIPVAKKTHHNLGTQHPQLYQDLPPSPLANL